MRRREMAEIRACASCETNEVRAIYRKKGFTGRLLDQIVNHITRNKKLWTDTMMTDELGLSKTSQSHPYRSAFVVGGSAVIGSCIPMIPFIFMSIPTAVITSLVLCSLTLFITGSYNAKLTVGIWWQRGLEMMIIGMLAALVGYGVGAAVGAVV
jgi:predicted membrane protein (TIGR00267 family)